MADIPIPLPGSPETASDDANGVIRDGSLRSSESSSERLRQVVATMREMSVQTDPQAMVRAYANRMETLFPVDRRVSLSRRGLEYPFYRVTRFSGWRDEVNPWTEPHKLPLHEGGLFAELLYGDDPRLIDELALDPEDPAARYLDGQRSLMAIPMLDGGVAVNMVVVTRTGPAAFDHEQFPENVWLANLFGRATHNLVLSGQLREAYEIVDRELRVVADIQQSLLPKEMPHIATLQLAARYETSHRAGGDYYDFFPLHDGNWGILIADVSGHGTPAAVVMAITHSIAHMVPEPTKHPGQMLSFINQNLTARYTTEFGAFVTAFYGVYDPKQRTLTYSSAGHNPPRLRRCGEGSVSSLEEARNIPLGLMQNVGYGSAVIALKPGDRILFYTDGITEAQNLAGEMFGVRRLDHLIEFGCTDEPRAIVDAILNSVTAFSEGAAAGDDRTCIVANVV